MENRTIVFLKTALLCTVFAVLFKWWTTGNPFHPSTILFSFIILVIILVSLSIAYKYFRYFLNIPLKELKKKIIPAFVLFLLIILLVSLTVIALSTYVFYLIMGTDTTDFASKMLEVEFPGTVKYYFIFALIASSFFFYKIWSQAADREQQLREENLKYRYRTLKTQVNPHFLFNSLNTLSEIVYIDAKSADNYIQKLASVYRFILRHEETDLLPLSEELEFVNQYFSLQKERGEDKIEMNIRVENAEMFRIVPISLQILIENALKHNAASKDNPLKIEIFIDGKYIVVTNNIQKKNILNDSSGTGLSNLKERVKLIMNKEMTVCQDFNQYIVKLPIIKVEA